ncbi:MAG: hypothetical protein QS748_09405 [Candidatus Endonucleobacter bathymodioli]|uniref:Uncharacterized protein n=1 Tax=Candidatus Endonucleibacter bathymodioli TaxID=539814 RepID=A0AA90STC0_9GAMM|nr:hypothetical protein [Candidatus Endonucleobacter bathymodioli]
MKHNSLYNKQFGYLDYQEFKELIYTITCSSAFATCTDLEQAISSSDKISEDQKVNLMSLLFMVSLRKGIYQENSLLSRIDSLILPVQSKESLIRIIKLLRDGDDVIAKHFMSMIENLFASPSACQKSLISLADWIESHPVLFEDERESLANLAKQRAMMLAMALEGDKEIYQEIINARGQWYLEAVGNAISIEELRQLQVSIVNDSMAETSQTQLQCLLKQAEANIEKNGSVDLEECIIYMIYKTVSNCQSNACVVDNFNYPDGTTQMIQWFEKSINSPLIGNLFSWEKHKADKCENGMLLKNFKFRSLLFYGY